MRELLKEFIELAPKEWGGYINASCDVALLMKMQRPGGYLAPRVEINNDRISAEAIIFLWDYLEGEGHWLSIGGTFHHGDPKGYGAPYVVVEPDSLPPKGKGMTRIEALVRACVALWKSKEQNP